ncbi:MAG: hypothetical protein K8R99_11540 [Actinomycetia bacterium]|nr:hypothetical protein [Actinomycetes bacterium]
MSALTRDLALQAVGRACGTAAIDFRPVNGEGREIRFLSTIDRRYRVLRGQRSRRGDLVVKVNSDSALAIEDAGLFEAEVWAFVMIIENEHHTVVETVAAEILGKTDGSPGQLIFGEQIILGGGGFADGTGVDIRFTPDDGGDLGDFFGDEEDDDGVGFGNTSG